MKTSQHKSIKTWNSEERPREKFEKRGAAALTDAELLAILLNTGTRNKTALDLARELLDSVHHSLTALSRIPLENLKKFHGIGLKKAVTLAAALELGRRRKTEEASRKEDIRSSRQAYEILAPDLEDETQEVFMTLFLNRAHRVIRKEVMARGGMTGVVADPKVIFKKALLLDATALIVAHNHPSGQLKPSPEDIQLTQKLKEAAAFLDMALLDHLIITAHHYFSFADEGLL
ncbi:MAG: DNA repair protein RadC [Flavobacteriales bacterium]|nr:DNA repair protein RadC [Flavobacteriales bacterium]